MSEVLAERSPGTSGAGAAPGAAQAPELAILVDGLVKTYGGRRVVDGLSFTVTCGEILALLGPNGAGKTTTVEVLEGYRSADGGRVRVLGLDPQREADQLRARIGVMLQEGGLYRAIGVREALRLFASYYAHPADPDHLLRLVELEDAAQRRYRQLSGGQKRRLALALALVGRPELVFLDEPTIGMDPQARRATWGIIRGLRERGVTVLLTTHYLEEAEQLADRVAIVDRGHLVALDTPEGLTRGDATVVRLRAQPGLQPARLAALPAALAVHEERPGWHVFETRAASDLLVELATLLRDSGVIPAEIRIGRESLEEVFLRLTEREPEP
ncbi:MAG: ABC transporter ATP-binding protein [Chloroflexi bacterium]|nr:ABC transporter ATP-binding protein [Chloroflexota bacterium]